MKKHDEVNVEALRSNDRSMVLKFQAFRCRRTRHAMEFSFENWEIQKLQEKIDFAFQLLPLYQWKYRVKFFSTRWWCRASKLGPTRNSKNCGKNFSILLFNYCLDENTSKIFFLPTDVEHWNENWRIDFSFFFFAHWSLKSMEKKKKNKLINLIKDFLKNWPLVNYHFLRATRSKAAKDDRINRNGTRGKDERINYQWIDLLR